MTLTEFLEARLADDERWANGVIDHEVAALRSDGLPDLTRDDLLTMVESDAWRRPLREVEAKRAIVESIDVLTGGDKSYTERLRHTDVEDARYIIARDIPRHLAAVYADHPDYREEWRPA